ncbi:MAG: hypothetical protein A3H32_19105 [Betaproteobacteria bacterium RIFCSPLOWO2_02_FULL_63_19]|nr:MAG: hypothetical protein A3H32_19105 [Betaproteobacteria bacterium RIFCSPLOWO2_02_FULL_63_19]
METNVRRLEIIFPALLIAFVLLVVGAGVFYYQYSFTVMRFPYVSGGLLILLAGWRIRNALAAPSSPADGSRAETESETAAIAPPPEESAREVLLTGLWLLGILPAVWIFGYPAGIPLYLMAYFRGHGERWAVSIALSLVALAVTYFVFILMLKVRLPVLPLGFS